MTFALGIYELFTYAIPGAMQLSVLLYIVVRLHAVDPQQLASASGVLQLVVAAVASYLVGHLTYLVAAVTDRIPWLGFPLHSSDAWRDVSDAVTRGGGGAVPNMHPMLLMSRIQLTHPDAGTEISRFRATGLMLRNATIPTFSALLVTGVEVAIGPHRLLAALAAVLLGCAVVGFRRFGGQMRYWANTKTYEMAYWIDREDPVSRGEGRPGRSGRP
jgi:hypothetical protein